jgi:Flp pilus assembly protein TadD
VRRLALVLALIGLVLAACGSSNHQQRLTQDKIKTAYETFFSAKSSVAQRVAVLQNGPQFKALVTEFANNPLAKNVSATVGTVTLQGANNAKVVYTVKFGGTRLPQQTGTAVRQNGSWKVGYQGLCKLVSLSGTTPTVCLHKKS